MRSRPRTCSPSALAWARDVAANTAPASVALSKRLLWEGLAESVPAVMRKEERAFAWIRRQPDAVEGVVSFVEKRPPRWKARPSRDLPDLEGLGSAHALVLALSRRERWGAWFTWNAWRPIRSGQRLARGASRAAG